MTLHACVTIKGPAENTLDGSFSQWICDISDLKLEAIQLHCEITLQRCNAKCDQGSYLLIERRPSDPALIHLFDRTHTDLTHSDLTDAEALTVEPQVCVFRTK